MNMRVRLDHSFSSEQSSLHCFIREPLRENKIPSRLMAASCAFLFFLLLILVLSLRENGMTSISLHTMTPSLIGALLFLPALWLQYRPQKIIIDHNGIAFTGVFGFHVPPLLAWRDVTLIRRTGFLNTENGRDEKLIFVTRYGNTFFFPFRHDGSELFRTEQEDVTLCGIVARHWRPVETIRTEEKQRIPQLQFSEEIGSRTRCVAFAALALVFTAAILSGLTPTHALSTPARYYWIGIGAIAGGSIAFLYMRKTANGLQEALSILLIGAASAWTMVPLTAGLPHWFGEQRNEIFVLAEENDARQRWRSLSSASLQFEIRSRGQDWRYHGLGTRCRLPLYYGLPGLYSLPETAYQSLRQ